MKDSFAGFAIEQPSNCYYANMAAYFHRCGLKPVSIFSGLNGLMDEQSIDSDVFKLEFIDRYLKRQWAIESRWHYIEVQPDSTVAQLRQEIDDAGLDSTILGFSMPIEFVDYRDDLTPNDQGPHSVYHYSLMALEGDNRLSIIDATSTNENSAPVFALEGYDLSMFLHKAQPYMLHLHDIDAIATTLQSRCALDQQSRAEQLKVELSQFIDSSDSINALIKAQWQRAEGADFSPQMNLFNFIAKHRYYYHQFLWQVLGGEAQHPQLAAMAGQIEKRYEAMSFLCFKAACTNSTANFNRVLQHGVKSIEQLIDSEKQFADQALQCWPTV